MKNVNKSIIVGVIVGVLLVFGIIKCRDIWKARQCQKEFAAFIEDQKKLDKALNEFGRSWIKAMTDFGGSSAEKTVAESEEANSDVGIDTETVLTQNTE